MAPGQLQDLEKTAWDLATADARITLELIRGERALLDGSISGEEYVRRVKLAARQRGALTLIVRQAANSGDIYTMMKVEQSILQQRYAELANTAEMKASLANALEQLEAALEVFLKLRDDPEAYKQTDRDYSLNRIGEVPKEQARQFFQAHLRRLRDLDKEALQESARDLLLARIHLIKRLTAAYDRLQHQVLGKQLLSPRRQRSKAASTVR